MINYEKKSALIIEDFAEFARSLRAMLNEIGLEDVDIVNTGESALRACSEKQYDIILSDYNLGHGKNGMQVLEELNYHKYLKSDAVFIMTTAENTTAMVMGALENQPDSYLTKPFNNAQLRSRLNNLVAKKTALGPLLTAFDKGKLNDALVLCDEMSETFPKYKSAIDKLKADILMKKRQYPEATAIYEAVLEKRPIPWALVGLAQAQMAKREFQGAATVLKETIAKFPMMLEAYDLLAECQMRLDEVEDAQTTLQEAIKRSPRVINRQNRLGELAEKNGDFESAIHAFKQSIRLGSNSLFKSPDSYIKYTNSVSHYIEVDAAAVPRNLLNETESYLKEYYKEYKDDKVSRLRGNVAEGVFLNNQGKQKEAQKCVDSAKTLYAAIETMLPGTAGLELAKGLKTLGEDSLAQSILQDAVQHNFEDTRFLEDALPFLDDKSIIEKGKQAHRLNSQGIKYFEQQEYPKAIECFIQAVDASPKNVSIILNTVQVLLKVHQSGNADETVIERCEDYLNSINNLAPDDPRFMRFSELLRLTRVIKQEQGL
ncbi:MAG: response regulator [Gammaproteobacteria bacterium]|nr:response regulator [Gammaproteobacteria bacterium]NVK89067.1 response regulator [Gammaproteobacteria bacterium]